MVEIPNASFVTFQETNEGLELRRRVPPQYAISGILAMIVIIAVISGSQIDMGELRFIVLCALVIVIPLLVLTARLFRAQVAVYDPVERVLTVNKDSEFRLTPATSILIQSRSGRSDDVQYTDCLIVESNQSRIPFLRVREYYSETTFLAIRDFFGRTGLTLRVTDIEE